MKRFYIVRLNGMVSSGPGTPSNWAIMDRETQRIADYAESQYAARQTAKLYNEGVFKPQEQTK